MNHTCQPARTAGLLRPLARGFLDHAGARVVRGDDAEAVLRVDVLGTAQGKLYDFMED